MNNENKMDILERSLDLIERFIHEDLPALRDSTSITQIRNILIHLATSSEISEGTISSNLGITKEQVHRAIETLKKAEFILSIPTYGGVKQSIKKQKVFFVSPTFRYSLARNVMKADRRNKVLKPLLLEDIVAMYLYRAFGKSPVLFTGGHGKTPSPDFIIDFTQHVIPVEVSMGTKPDASQLNVKNKLYGLIISKKATKPFIRQNDNVVVPLSWFLLI